MIFSRLLLFIVVISGPCLLSGQTLNDVLNKKDTTAAIELLKKGADINNLDANGNSSLMSACRWGNDDIVHFLLAHGATADQPRSAKGRSPLMIACAYYSGKSACSMLIQKGADVNATASDKTTALMLAAQNAKLDVVTLLLQKGAKANAKDDKGKTALDYANAAEVTDFLKSAIKDSRIDKDAVVAALKAAK